MAADVPFYVALAREADGLLVELAVGTGRAEPIAYLNCQENAMVVCSLDRVRILKRVERSRLQ